MDSSAVAQANAALNIVHDIATLLDTGLDKEEVAILIALVENGVNPVVQICIWFSNFKISMPFRTYE